MSEDIIMREIEAMREEIRLLDRRLSEVELKQSSIDKIMDRIAILDNKIDELLTR